MARLNTARIGAAVVRGNLPRVPVRIETNVVSTGLGEARWGTGVAALGLGPRQPEPVRTTRAHRTDRAPVDQGRRGAPPHDRHSLRDRRRVRLEVATPPVYRTGRSPVRSGRRLRRRRTHRGDEDRRLERGQLFRSHAGRPARRPLYGRRGPPRCRRPELRSARVPGHVVRTAARLRRPAIFPLRTRLEGARQPVPTGPGLGVEVDEATLLCEPFRFGEPPHPGRRHGYFTNR